MEKKRRGVALILALIIIVILFLLGRAAFIHSLTENQAFQRTENSLKAFWLAEAGLSKASYEILQNNITNTTRSFANGTFAYNISVIGADNYIIEARGNFRNTTRSIKTKVSRNVNPSRPNNFYDFALYCAGDLFEGNGNWRIDGNVTYALNFSQSGNPGTINGSVIKDPSINPLFELNFDYLKSISISQGNYHNSSSLNGPFPTGFWYNQTQLIPNVVYLEGDLVLTGNTKTGGLFITRGEVICNETEANETNYNSSLAGTVRIDGIIYTPGKFTMKGTADIIGGVFSGQTAILSGNPHIIYNATYMEAVKNIKADTIINETLWRETTNPYNITYSSE